MTTTTLVPLQIALGSFIAICTFLRWVGGRWTRKKLIADISLCALFVGVAILESQGYSRHLYLLLLLVFSLLGVAVAMPGEQLMSMGILAILVGEKWGSWIYVIALCIALSCALLVQASTREAVSDIHYMRYVGTFGREKAFEPTMLNKLEKNIFSAIPIYCLTLPFLMSWMF